MKSVWVTGAHGFLGRHLCRHLSGKGVRVAGIGHGYWGPGEPSEWGIHTWEFADIHLPSLEDLAGKTSKPDAIFHMAGSSSVPMSVRNPYLDFQRTVGTTLDVLEYIRLKSPQTKIIYPSSAAVYGSVAKAKLHEDLPINPISPYGSNKYIAEILCQSYSSQFGIAFSIIRFFSLYGSGLKKQLLWDLCCKFATNKGEIPLYGTGEEVRDWLHVDDAVDLLLSASENASTEAYPVNGGTGIGTTVREIAKEIGQFFGTDRNIVFNNIFREGDPRFYLADTSRAKSWGWGPKRELRDGLREYVQWFKNYRGLE